jgi:hypothetical protein
MFQEVLLGCSSRERERNGQGMSRAREWRQMHTALVWKTYSEGPTKNLHVSGRIILRWFLKKWSQDT